MQPLKTTSSQSEAEAVMASFAARYCSRCSAPTSMVWAIHGKEITRLHMVGDVINLSTGERREIWQCLICKKEE